MRAPVPIQRQVSGAATVEFRDFHGHRGVVAEVGPSAHLGASSLADAEKLAAGVRHARESRVPFIAFIASTGALVGDGLPASHGWGLFGRALVEASGIVPLVAVVTGPAVSGAALLLGIVDHVIMCPDSYSFVSGPAMVRDVTGVSISTTELGGARVHARQSGLASLLASDRDQAELMVAELLDHFPPHCDELPGRRPTTDPADRPCPEAGDLLPATATGSYDVRGIIRAIVDDSELLELRADWSPNLVTALARIDGRSVGIVANQPQSIAGTLDIPASQKGARFVSTCDVFNLPLITLVDTPGFFPGKDLEWRGMIRHGAQLAFAYARATVPRVSVTLRKSYGGAYIVMDSKYLGNDLALAWPSAEIAVMGGAGAMEILHRNATVAERAERQLEYEDRLLNPYIAAERGSIDAIIEPAETRARLAAALSVLEHKREAFPQRAHDNTPL